MSSRERPFLRFGLQIQEYRQVRRKGGKWVPEPTKDLKQELKPKEREQKANLQWRRRGQAAPSPRAWTLCGRVNCNLQMHGDCWSPRELHGEVHQWKGAVEVRTAVAGEWCRASEVPQEGWLAGGHLESGHLSSELRTLLAPSSGSQSS